RLTDEIEGVVHGRRRLVSVLCLPAHRLEYHGRECFWYFRVERSRVRGVLFQMLRDERPGRVGLEGDSSTDALVEHDARGIEIAARIEIESLQLFRGHVVRRADGHPGFGQSLALGWIGEPRDAEIHDLQEPA